MKAVRLYGKGDLRVEDMPTPLPSGEDEVALDVLAAGICGSDLHNYRTGQWISRSPSVPGHEVIGRVTGVGSAVRDLEAGDRVVADSRYWCGTCDACGRGQHHVCARLGFVGEVCDGGFAEAMVLPRRLLHRVPPGLPDDIAVMAEPVAVALHAVRRLRPDPAASVLVAGCGPIGGLAALVLSDQGHRDIRIADLNEHRLQRVAEVTGAKVMRLDKGEEKVGFALEATGNIKVLQSLLGRVENCGSIALVGISHGSFELDPNTLVEREVNIIGCHAFKDELPEAIALLARRQEQARRLIDCIITLDEVPGSYVRLLAGKAAGLKTIVRP